MNLKLTIHPHVYSCLASHVKSFIICCVTALGLIFFSPRALMYLVQTIPFCLTDMRLPSGGKVELTSMGT